MPRAALFIDGAYLDKLLTAEHSGAHVDLARLAQELGGEADILRTYYYHCAAYQSNPPAPEESRKQSDVQRFFTILSRLNRLQVRLG